MNLTRKKIKDSVGPITFGTIVLAFVIGFPTLMVTAGEAKDREHKQEMTAFCRTLDAQYVETPTYEDICRKGTKVVWKEGDND